MPPTNAKSGFKTQLWMDDGGGAGFTQVAEIGDIAGLDVEMQFDDATNMDSPSGVEESIAVGVKSVTDLTTTVSLIESDASQAKLATARDAGTKCNWRLVYPSGTKRRAFAGFVKSMGEALPMKGRMVRSLVLKPTGPIVTEAHP